MPNTKTTRPLEFLLESVADVYLAGTFADTAHNTQRPAGVTAESFALRMANSRVYSHHSNLQNIKARQELRLDTYRKRKQKPPNALLAFFRRQIEKVLRLLQIIGVRKENIRQWRWHFLSHMAVPPERQITS